MINENTFKDKLVSIAEMTAGTAFSTAAFGLIIIPQGFAAGGVTGLARIISGFLPIPLSVLVFILNMSLLVLGLIFEGREFALKTVALSILYPVMLDLFSRYPLLSLASDPVISAAAAGIMLGVGAGLILRSGASSGGFDVAAVILNRKFGVPIAAVMNICDGAVILVQATGAPLQKTLYGITVICISAFAVNRVVACGRGESQIMIFSERYEDIARALLKDLDVGLTYLHAQTGYRERQMEVIVSVMPYRKLVPMKKLITSIDPTAFVVVDRINSVLGRGYTLDKGFPGTETAGT